MPFRAIGTGIKKMSRSNKLKNNITNSPLNSKTKSDKAKVEAGVRSLSLSQFERFKEKKPNSKFTIEHLQELKNFKKEALDLLINHLLDTEYGKYPVLLREINYLVHYMFSIIEDDYFSGNKKLKTKLTKIDDYVFSQYRKNPDLKENIDKIIKIGFTKRFSTIPKENFLSYLVFIEEMNFEIILLFKDFYGLLESAQTEPELILKYRRDTSIDVAYKNKSVDSNIHTVEPSFMTYDNISHLSPDEKPILSFDDIIEKK